MFTTRREWIFTDPTDGTLFRRRCLHGADFHRHIYELLTLRTEAICRSGQFIFILLGLAGVINFSFTQRRVSEAYSVTFARIVALAWVRGRDIFFISRAHDFAADGRLRFQNRTLGHDRGGHRRWHSPNSARCKVATGGLRGFLRKKWRLPA